MLETISTPVGDAWAELHATGWMSFYDLQGIVVPYDIYDTSNYETRFVLQAVKTDPSQEAPTEDVVLSASAGDRAGVVEATSFTNATANDAQLFRVVFQARTSGANEGTGRSWFAVAARYA